MITEYHRPQSLDEALKILSNSNAHPLGGGTLLSRPGADPIEVVDLQALGLNQIKQNGNAIEIGATTTLQQLLENDGCPAPLQSALRLEAPLNLRNAATVAGTLVVADGRSTFTTALLALDARLTLQPKNEEIPLGNFLPLRDERRRGRLITRISMPANVRLAFEYVARTPADKPIVCVAVTRWPSGRTRLAVGGYGKAPMLAMDGTEAEGASTSDFVLRSAETAARNAFHEAGDEWASAEYRMDVAATLTKRSLEKIRA